MLVLTWVVIICQPSMKQARQDEDSLQARACKQVKASTRLQQLAGLRSSRNLPGSFAVAPHAASTNKSVGAAEESGAAETRRRDA